MRTFEIYGEDYEMLEDESGEWVHIDSLTDLAKEVAECEHMDDVKKVLDEEGLL